MAVEIRVLCADDGGRLIRVAPGVFDAALTTNSVSAYLREPNHWWSR